MRKKLSLGVSGARKKVWNSSRRVTKMNNSQFSITGLQKIAGGNRNVRSMFVPFRESDLKTLRLVTSPSLTDNTLFLEQKKGQILRWLSEIEYIKHHRNALEGILQDTGQWLLDKKEFREWRSNNISSIFWLHGIRKKLSGVIALETIRVLTSFSSWCRENETYVCYPDQSTLSFSPPYPFLSQRLNSE